MSTNHTKAKALLTGAGLYKSKWKIAVLQILLKAQTPISRKQIARKLGKNAPQKATLYRNLETLCSSGLVHKAYVGKKTWHFETSERCTETHCHPHFTCQKCGKTTCLTDAYIPPVKGIKKGFIVKRQKLHLLGLCPQCSCQLSEMNKKQ